jgi:hypothetical protein
MIDRLCHIKDTLTLAIEMQICDLENTDTKELGEAIDMIKDLEEAIYYHTVTEAMKNPEAEWEWKMKDDEKGEHMYAERMRYASGNRGRRADGTYYADGGSRSGSNYGNPNSMNYADSGMPMEHWDEKDGHSYMSRRMYMEAKDMKKDKSIQLKELEKYMQELSQDITEMISDASMEEKQYLEKKISSLASKIGQMK